jgi:hypothetical protein
LCRAGVIKKDAVDELSRVAVSRRLPLYEAGFIAGCAYARADVLVPVGRDQWDIVEVKSTTKAKEIHVSDLALQRHVYESAGLDIRRCFVMHLDSEYVRRGEIDPPKLFAKTDVTADVDDVVGDVGSELKRMVRIIGQQRAPNMEIGLHCSDPYECPLRATCWKAVPKHSVFTLTHVGQKAFDWSSGRSLSTFIPRARFSMPASRLATSFSNPVRTVATKRGPVSSGLSTGSMVFAAALCSRDGGKDGHPLPVPLTIYDETLAVRRRAVDQAKLGQDEKLAALRRLDDQCRTLEAAAAGRPQRAPSLSLPAIVDDQRRRAPAWDGRTCFDSVARRPRQLRLPFGCHPTPVAD